MDSVLVNPVSIWTVFAVAVVTLNVLQASAFSGCSLCLVQEFVCQNRHFRLPLEACLWKRSLCMLLFHF